VAIAEQQILALGVPETVTPKIHSVVRQALPAEWMSGVERQDGDSDVPQFISVSEPSQGRRG